VILYDADITVNLEFQTKFSQYCDHIQMSKLFNLMNIEDDEDISGENDLDIPYVFDENKFVIEDRNPVELEIEQEFFDEFATAVFGEVINNL